MRHSHAREPASPRCRQDRRRGTGAARLPSFAQFLVAAACLVLGALLTTVTAAAQADGPLIVVFDGSGSMWGTIEGSRRSKLALSREALAEAVQRRNGATSIGLVTFGARSGGSCRSVETAFAPGPGRIDDVSDLLGRFTPQGRGPIVLGLETARDLISGQPGAQLLLIHDGDDNCDGDLCAFANAFARSHPGVRINALSLGLKRSDRAGVACLTKATGGQWIEADDADAISEGLEQIVANLGGPRAPSPPATAAADTAPDGEARAGAPEAAPPPAAANGANLSLAAVLKATGTAVPSGGAWHIKALGESGDDAFQRRLEEASTSVQLAPGRYEVTLETQLQSTSRTLEIKAGEPQTVSFALDGGFLDIRAAGRRAGNGPKPIATIEELDGDTGPARVIWSGALARTAGLLVPAGRYRITLADGLARATQSIDLSDGEARTLALAPPNAELRVRVAGLDNSQLAHATVELAADDPTAPEGRRLIARSAATAATFNVAPGTYHVTLDVFGQENTEIVVVPGGEAVDARISIDQMGLSVTSRLGANGEAEQDDVRYRVWRADDLEEPLHVSRAGEPVFYLTPGMYRIESRLGHQNAVIVREFEIGRQRFGKLALRHEAGRVSFKLADDEPLVDSNAFWELRDRNQRLIWRTIAASPVMTLKAGLYTVLVEGAQKSYQAKFAVVAGHDQSVILGEE
jgi:Ca-activated chloride channel family protein